MVYYSKVLVINMVSKSTLNIFRNLAELRSNDYEIARRISNALNLHIKEEEFVNMSVKTRKTPYNNEEISCINIKLEKHDIEITILDTSYYVTNSYNNEYQIIREFLYEVKEPITESFGINNGKCYVSIKEEYPYSSIVIENKDMSIKRTHLENYYSDSKGKNGIFITTFVNDVDTDKYSEHNEVLYFPNKNEMYHVSVVNKEDEYSFIGGATLNSPRYRLYPAEMTQEVTEIYEKVGIMEDSKTKYPKIFMKTHYITDDIINRVELHLIKYKSMIGIQLNDNGEAITDQFPGIRNNNITLEDLYRIKDRMINKYGDKPYIDLLTHYLDELIARLTVRIEHDFESIVSYNGDVLDFYINQGKVINDVPGKDIAHRGFDLYLRKNNLEVLFDTIKIPDITIKSDKESLTNNLK